MFLRDRPEPLFPLASLKSDSSGGSERGLEVAVSGLPGGLVSSSFSLTIALGRDNLLGD